MAACRACTTPFTLCQLEQVTVPLQPHLNKPPTVCLRAFAAAVSVRFSLASFNLICWSLVELTQVELSLAYTVVVSCSDLSVCFLIQLHFIWISLVFSVENSGFMKQVKGFFFGSRGMHFVQICYICYSTNRLGASFVNLVLFSFILSFIFYFPAWWNNYWLVLIIPFLWWRLEIWL